MKTVKEVAQLTRSHPNRIRDLCKKLGVKKKDGAFAITEAETNRIKSALKK